MKASLFTIVTVLVEDDDLMKLCPINKFVGCFTKVPNKEILIDAIYYKAELHRIPRHMLLSVLKVVQDLPFSDLAVDNHCKAGMVKVFTEEPLFKV